MTDEPKKKNASFAELELGPTGKIVADNIARLRDGYGISYNNLSKTLGEKAIGNPIPAVGLRRIEAYARRVSVDDLLAIARALGVSPLALLTPGSTEHPLGTAVPENATFREFSAWLRGEISDFNPGSLWHLWRRGIEDAIERIEQAEGIAVKWEKRAEEDPGDQTIAAAARAARRQHERAIQDREEAQERLEALRYLIDGDLD